MKNNQISPGVIITSFVIVFITLAGVVIPMQIELEELQGKVQSIQIQLDDIKMHSKDPCMSIPDGSPCWDKTVFFRMPGGSLRKEIRRICAWKSPVAQKWKTKK